MAPLQPRATAFADLQVQLYECEKTNSALETTVESLQECCHELQQEVRQKTLCIEALRETIETLEALYQERAIKCERLELKLSSLTFDPTPIIEVEQDTSPLPSSSSSPHQPFRKKKKPKVHSNNHTKKDKKSSKGKKKYEGSSKDKKEKHEKHSRDGKDRGKDSKDSKKKKKKRRKSGGSKSKSSNPNNGIEGTAAAPQISLLDLDQDEEDGENENENDSSLASTKEAGGDGQDDAPCTSDTIEGTANSAAEDDDEDSDDDESSVTEEEACSLQTSHEDDDDEMSKGTEGGYDDEEEEEEEDEETPTSLPPGSSSSKKENVPIDEAAIAEKLTEGRLRIAFFHLLLQRDQTNLRNLQLQRQLNKTEKQVEELSEQLNKSTTFVSLRYSAPKEQKPSPDYEQPTANLTASTSRPNEMTPNPESPPNETSQKSSDPLHSFRSSLHNTGSKPLKWLMKGQKISQFHPPSSTPTTTAVSPIRSMRLRPWIPHNGDVKRDPPATGEENNGQSKWNGDGRLNNGLPENPPDSDETVTFYPIRMADRKAYMSPSELEGPDSPATIRRVEI